MTVVPVLSAVFESQNESRHCRWLGERYNNYIIGREMIVCKASVSASVSAIYSRHTAHVRK